MRGCFYTRCAGVSSPVGIMPIMANNEVRRANLVKQLEELKTQRKANGKQTRFLRDRTVRLLAQGRKAGLSWEEIAAPLGVSHSCAWQIWKRAEKRQAAREAAREE